MWDRFRIETYNVFFSDAVVRVSELAIQAWQVMEQYDYFIRHPNSAYADPENVN